MKKRVALYVTLLLVILQGIAKATTQGFVTRVSCASITDPVSWATVCYDATLMQLLVWNGSTWQLVSGGSTGISNPMTSNLAAAGFKITGLGTDTSTGDVLSRGQSTLNALAAPTANFSMASHKLTSLPAGTGSGDSFAYGLNDLSQLGTATGNYNLGGYKLTNSGAAASSGDLVSLIGSSQIAEYNTSSFNVKSAACGAKGDGSTDDTDAIQTCYNAACALGASNPSSAPSVFVPSGRYVIGKYPLIFNCAYPITFKGAGRSSTVIITGNSLFPLVIQEPPTALSDIGTFFTTSLATGSGNSLNLPGTQNWVLRLSDANQGNNASQPFQHAAVMGGMGAFSIEWYSKLTGPVSGSATYQAFSANGGPLVDGGNAQFNGLSVNVNSNSGSPCMNWYVYLSGSGQTGSSGCTGSYSANTIHTHEFTFDGSNVCMFLDGSRIGTTTASGTVSWNPSEVLALGASTSNFGAISGQWQGQLDSIRISNAARHSCSTTSFTPPTAKFASDGSTAFLQNFTASHDTSVKVDSIYGSGGTTYIPFHIPLSTFHSNATLNNFQDMSFRGGSFAVFEQNNLNASFRNVQLSGQSEFGIYCDNHCYGADYENIFADGGAYSVAAIGLYNDSGESRANHIAVQTGYYGIIDDDSGVDWDNISLNISAQTDGDIVYRYGVDQFGSGSFKHISFDAEAAGNSVPIMASGSGLLSISDSVLLPGGTNDLVQVCAVFNPLNIRLTNVSLNFSGNPTQLIHDLNGTYAVCANSLASLGSPLTWTGLINNAPISSYNSHAIWNIPGDVVLGAVDTLRGSANATVSNSSVNVFPAIGSGAPVATTSLGTVAEKEGSAGFGFGLRCCMVNAAGARTNAGGSGYTLNVYQNGSTNAETCGIGSGTACCQDTTHSFSIAQDDQLALGTNPSSSPTALIPQCSMVVTH